MAETYPTAIVAGLLVAESADDWLTTPRKEIELERTGIVGDRRHHSAAKPAGPRLPWLPKGLLVANLEQVSMIDADSLQGIADEMEIDGDETKATFGEERLVFVARRMGINVVFAAFQGTEKIPSFYDIPNSTHVGRLESGKMAGAVIHIVRYNPACTHPGKRMAKDLIPDATHAQITEMGAQFKAAADLHGRGYVGTPIIETLLTGPLDVAEGDVVSFCSLPSARDYVPRKAGE
ncbi:MAG TPA: hypothetical protein VLF60_05480 [Candidatus Saccharimonadales bacterium]|nr:hypothetical protein [Candidatus Saccharimonadales bacterium]